MCVRRGVLTTLLSPLRGFSQLGNQPTHHILFANDADPCG